MLFHILRKEGFHNVSWYGVSGADRGRDITCERTELLGTRLINYQCIVQCKLYHGNIARSELYEELSKSAEFSPQYYILATTGIIGANTKDWLAAQREKFGFSIVLWERTDLEILLERHQDIRARFLGIPTEETYVLAQLSDQYKGFESIIKWPIEPEVRAILGRSWDYAIQMKTTLTVAHLLCAMMDKPTSVLCQLLRQVGSSELEIIRENVRIYASSQAPSEDLSPGMTQSFRSVIEFAYDTSKKLLGGRLTDRLLCWSALSFKSGSTDLLAQHLKIRQHEVPIYIASAFFTKVENAYINWRLVRPPAVHSLTVPMNADLLKMSVTMTHVKDLPMSDETKNLLISSNIHFVVNPFISDEKVSKIPGITAQQIDEVRKAVDRGHGPQ